MCNNSFLQRLWADDIFAKGLWAGFVLGLIVGLFGSLVKWTRATCMADMR